MADEKLTIVKSEPLPTLSLKDPQADSGALGLQGAAASVPLAARAAEGIANSPNFAKTAGAIANGATTLTGLAHGAWTGNMREVIESPIAGWAAGRGGYFLGKGAQSVADSVARAARMLQPYAQTISTVSGAQGVLDLAQMADQTRQDIGTIGVSLNAPRSKDDRDAHPALVNAIVGKISDLAAKLKDHGIPAAEATAVKLISDGNAATFGKLMTLVMGSRSVQP